MGAADSRKAGRRKVRFRARCVKSETEDSPDAFELQDASLTLPEGQPLRAASAAVAIEGNSCSLEPATVSIGRNESAEVEGGFDPGGRPGSENHHARVERRGHAVVRLGGDSAAGSDAAGNIGAAGRAMSGARAKRANGRASTNCKTRASPWTDWPIRCDIQSAAVSLDGPRVSVTRMRAEVGEIAFTGDYRWEPAAVRPHKFHLPDSAGGSGGTGAHTCARAGARTRISRAYVAVRLGARAGVAQGASRGRNVSIGTLALAATRRCMLNGARAIVGRGHGAFGPAERDMWIRRLSRANLRSIFPHARRTIGSKENFGM